MCQIFHTYLMDPIMSNHNEDLYQLLICGKTSVRLRHASHTETCMKSTFHEFHWKSAL